jgi:hypothetical protein
MLIVQGNEDPTSRRDRQRLLLLRLLHPFLLGPLACFPSQLIWNYRFCIQSVGLLRRGISPVARPLPTQDNTDTSSAD